MKDGGPAFPAEADGGCGPWPGMTLRDYFAAKAMQGMLASEIGGQGVTKPERDGMTYKQTNAIEAYAWADAMLAAREVPNGT